MKRRAASLITLVVGLALGACASFSPGVTPDVTYEGPVATGSKLYKHQASRNSNETPSKVRVINEQELRTGGSPTLGRVLSRPGVN